MVTYNTIILKFDDKGEKTSWTYIEIPADVASQLKPNTKKSFRVKGKLDNYAIEKVAILPMGDSNFIMPLNAAMRKGFGKREGAMLNVQLEADDRELVLNEEFMACLEDDPDAITFFNSLTKSHRQYFSKWIESAKTDPTKVKRITMAVNALSRKMGYPEMLRAQKSNR